MRTQLSSVWSGALNLLKEMMSETSYEYWIEQLQPLGIHEGVLYLKMPTELHLEIVKSMHLDKIKEAVNNVSSEQLNIQLIDYNESMPECLTYAVDHSENRMDDAGTLNPRYTFESFVVGESNSLAHAGAIAVSKTPGAPSHNPLFLYGDPGLGKTHLAHAVGNKVKQDNPNANVLYVTSEKFMTEFIAMLRDGSGSVEFRNKYRMCDVLIVDDIQFLAKKNETQIEFFHTFNALYEAGKQIIITSDRPPRELKELEERIRSRMEMSLITGIQRPDLETRIAILKKKASEEHFVVSDDILYYIAEHLKSNIRNLEGVLKRLMAYNVLMGKPITMELANEAIIEFTGKSDDPHVNTEYILSVVANYFNVTSDEILSAKKNQPIAYARQIAMYLIREFTNLSLPKIGQELGGRDHATIMYGISAIKKKMQDNEDTKKVIDELMKNLENRE